MAIFNSKMLVYQRLFVVLKPAKIFHRSIPEALADSSKWHCARRGR